MSIQDCPNCHYTAPKPEEKKKGDDCAQCFYQPEVKPEPVEECAQCFYQPEEKTEEEKKEADNCAQCFYQPPKE